MLGRPRSPLLPWFAMAAGALTGATAAACGKDSEAGKASNEPAPVSESATKELEAFRAKVGFQAVHTGPRKLPMVFRLGADIPESWVPVIQRSFDDWERGVGKDLFAFAGGTLSGRASARVAKGSDALPAPFEDGLWSIVASKKSLCPKKSGDNPAACARFSPGRDAGGTVVDWHPREQDVIFDVGSFDFRTTPPVPKYPGEPGATGQDSENVDAETIALSLRQVLAHELGHVLGLPHSLPSEGDSIMGPASLARKGTYLEEGPVVPQALDHEKVRKLVGAWELGAAE